MTLLAIPPQELIAFGPPRPKGVKKGYLFWVILGLFWVILGLFWVILGVPGQEGLKSGHFGHFDPFGSFGVIYGWRGHI